MASAEKHMDIQLFDTTLRDGTQSEGLSLSLPKQPQSKRGLLALAVGPMDGSLMTLLCLQSS